MDLIEANKTTADNDDQSIQHIQYIDFCPIYRELKWKKEMWIDSE